MGSCKAVRAFIKGHMENRNVFPDWEKMASRDCTHGDEKEDAQCPYGLTFEKGEEGCGGRWCWRSRCNKTTDEGKVADPFLSINEVRLVTIITKKLSPNTKGHGNGVVDAIIRSLIPIVDNVHVDYTSR